jgi:transposase InsO family protein
VREATARPAPDLVDRQFTAAGPDRLWVADIIYVPTGDHGCQYTSLAFGRRCRDFGVRPSMGSVGDAYDNALCESFFATLECELLDRHRFPTHAAARLAVFDFIEGWYNPRRCHSALDYLSPMTFERTHARDDRTVPSGSTIDQGGAISLSPQGWYSDHPESRSLSAKPGQLQIKRARTTGPSVAVTMRGV